MCVKLLLARLMVMVKVSPSVEPLVVAVDALGMVVSVTVSDKDKWRGV